jgi:radical SAM superfamily enzyme YgiQ (UPF0313 family)
MYDAILISPHYNYINDGSIIPSPNSADYDDLSMIIPLGIIYIAQYLHDCGFKVQVVHLPHEMQMYDLKLNGLKKDRLANPVEEILKKYPAYVCGIQLHFYVYCGAAVFISDLYRKLFPASKIFLGGSMATALWKELLAAAKDIDGIILGEGEKIFKTIVEKSLSAKAWNMNDINGVAFKDYNGDFIYKASSGKSVLKIDEIPIIDPAAPPFGNLVWQERQFISISRGLCPEKCSYCVGNNENMNVRAYQTVKIDTILRQLHVYQESGIHDIFLGENQFLNTAFMSELFENIIREDFLLYFELETHPVLFKNRKLLTRMIEAKFLRFTMGCESGSDSVLKRMGRNSNFRQILDSVERIVERGGIVLTSWISNLPGETDTEFQETQRILRKVVQLGGLVYWIENLHVLPGSKLYEKPEEFEIEILLNKLEDWIRWSIFSKKYVSFDEVYKKPLNYLTHLNKNVSPQLMVERFHKNRKLARSLIPEMKFNMENRLKGLPSEILKTEMQVLEWYKKKGWKLWLF